MKTSGNQNDHLFETGNDEFCAGLDPTLDVQRLLYNDILFVHVQC